MHIKHFYLFLFLFFTAVTLQAQSLSTGAKFKKNLIENNQLISNSQAFNPLKLKSAVVKYRLDSLTSREDNGGIWDIGTTEHYTYNSRLLLKSSYTITSQNEILREFFYNAAGLLKMYSIKSGDSLTNNWNNSSKFIYGYNIDSTQNYMTQFSWDVNGNQWVPTDSLYRDYNSAGQNTVLTHFTWNKVSISWNNFQKTDYTYNSGSVISLLMYNWNSASASWQTSFSRTYRLNSGGHTLGWTDASYNSTTSNWDSTFKAEYFYDVNYNPITEVYSNYNSGSQQWNGFFRYTYDYNLSVTVHDLIASVIVQFLPDEREKITNQPLSYQIALWNAGIAQWNVVDSSTYHYSQQSITLTETVNPEWKCYPNPATGQVYFTFPETKNARIEIYNSAGQMVIQSYLRMSKSLDIRNLKAGVYTYQLYFDKEMQQGKLLVE